MNLAGTLPGFGSTSPYFHQEKTTTSAATGIYFCTLPKSNMIHTDSYISHRQLIPGIAKFFLLLLKVFPQIF